MSTKKLIGIFATDISSRVQSNLYRELNEKAQQLGYNLVLFSGTFDKVNFDKTTLLTLKLYEMAENMEFAAFIIHAQSIGNLEMIYYLIEMGKRKNIPVFAYDGEALGLSSMDGVITLNPDYKRGFAESVRHLIEHHSCRNIFMLAGLKDNKYSDDRIEMYRAEMEAHGIPYSEAQIGYGNFWEIPAIAAVEKFLDSGLPTPDAICCANDAMAITATKVLKSRGLRVPEDVLITGFDGIEDGKYNFPAIATCEPNLEAVADFIFDSIEGRNTNRDYMIPLCFQPKESCGCSYRDKLEDKKEIALLVDNSRRASWMEHMLATMEVELIDSGVLSDSIGYMEGALKLFEKYSSLFCIRDDLESATDYTEPFEKMRVHLNAGFLPGKEYEAFPVNNVIPDYEAVLESAQPGEIFMVRLIHCANKLYGYHVVRTTGYTSNEVRLLGQFTERFTYIIESMLRNSRLKLATRKLSEMYDRMSEIYIRDTMTGLYNRHGYYQELQEYLKRSDILKGYIQIISVDMDGMKQINDNYGHMEGDNAIKAVAKAISECFAHPCISARFGGDEFTVALFTETGEEPTAEKLSLKLNNYLKTVSLLADKEYSVGVSVGRAVAKLSEVGDLKDVEKLADDRMYINKRARKAKRI